MKCWFYSISISRLLVVKRNSLIRDLIISVAICRMRNLIACKQNKWTLMSFQSHPNLFMVLFIIIIVVEMNDDGLNSEGHKFHIWAMGRVCIVFGLEHQRGAMQRKSRRFHHPRQFQPRHKMRLLLQQLHHLPHHPTVSTYIFSDGAHLIIHHQIRFPFALLIDEINFSVPVPFLLFSFFYFIRFPGKSGGCKQQE